MPASAHSVRVFAPAKINLLLHVGDRRVDGYHDLESLAAFVGVGDELWFEDAAGFSLDIEGQFGASLAKDDTNLVLRAARALSDAHGGGRCARIVLRKNLPVASGIGGGSADAAATLRALAKLWQVEIDHSELRGLAAHLGSDVPVCIASVPSWMEGRGERITELAPLPQLSMVLVNPGIAVPTKAVFDALGRRHGLGGVRPASFPDADALLEFLRAKSNDLEEPARSVAPVIGEVLEALAGTRNVKLIRMSGSGATCFGLFKDARDAANAATSLRQARPHWWVRDTSFYAAAADQ